MMSTEEERGPGDYDPMSDERRILINIIRRQSERGGGGNYNEGGGERAILKWLLGLSATLIVVSVVGGVALYGKVSAIEANQASQQRQLDQLSNTVASIRRAP